MEETKTETLLKDEQHTPKAIQTIVAVLFVVAVLLVTLQSWFIMLLIDSLGAELSYLISHGGSVLSVICWGILTLHANNKATRLATSFLAGTHLVMIFLTLYQFFLEEQQLPQIVLYIIQIIYTLAIVYLLSLIVTNNKLSTGNAKWVNTLIASYCFSLSIYVVDIFLSDFLAMQLQYNLSEHFYFTGGFLTYWIWVLNLLCAIGMWKLARSEAFGGKFDETSAANLSPFNRWMAAGFVVPSIVMLAVYLLYANCDLFI